jgi:hypothetical protein
MNMHSLAAASSSLEMLESRIAPAAVFVNARTAAYDDVDGDHVTVSFSKSILTDGAGGNVTSVVQVNAGGQLTTIDLTGVLASGTNITVTAKPGPTGGDGLANVGYIKASAAHGQALGVVKITGDLGEIAAGNDMDTTGVGLASLTVTSLGRFGQSTGAPGFNSTVFGKVGSVKVSGDDRAGSFNATSFGPITVGGSVAGIASTFQSDGDMGMVKIAGDLDGFLIAGGNLKGAIIGGLGNNIQAGGDLGIVKIGGDLLLARADGKFTGLIVGGSLQSFHAGKDLGFVTVTGGTTGNMGADHLGPVTVGGDFLGTITATSIKSLKIGGNFGAASAFGKVTSTGDIGPVLIGGDAVGGATAEAGKIDCGGNLASLTIRGSMIGGAGNFDTIPDPTHGVHEGQVFVVGKIGPVSISGDMRGGAGDASAEIRATAGIGSVYIGGSLVGAGLASGQIATAGKLGVVTIHGSLVGGTGSFSGRIGAGGDIAGVKIGGSFLGGPASTTAAVTQNGILVSGGGVLGPVIIGGDLRGGSLGNGDMSHDSTGYIQAATIKSVFIGGSIRAGFDGDSGSATLTKTGSIRADNDIGSITVLGSVLGSGSGDPSDVNFKPVVISARGKASLPATNDVAIGRITVGGSVQLANIAAGFDIGLAPKNADAQIGTVTVGGDWVSSNLLAGVQDAGDGYGNSSDAKMSGASVKDGADLGGRGAISKIASVIIKGNAIGTISATDFLTFGIEAQQLGSLRVGGATVALTAGAGNDLMGPGNTRGQAHPLGATFGTTIDDHYDFHAYEVPLT